MAVADIDLGLLPRELEIVVALLEDAPEGHVLRVAMPCHVERSHPERVGLDLERLLTAEEGFACQRINLGNLLVGEGELDEAVDHFQAALKISSDNSSAHNNLGTALGRQGKIADAILCFQEAVRLKPDYTEAHYNLGSAYLSQGRTDEAISEYTGILRRRPDFAPAQRGLLKARQRQAK